MSASSFLRPRSDHRMADGGAPAWGRRGPLGCRGAAAFCGPEGPTKPKHGRGPLAPAHALCALCAPAAPPGPLVVFRPFGQGACSFAPISCKQNKPAAPDERRASIFRWKSEEVFQLVFPRFFQKRQGGRAERRQWRKKRGGSPVSKGVEGSRFSGDAQRPLRTARGAAPPTGSRGSAPGSPPA